MSHFETIMREEQTPLLRRREKESERKADDEERERERENQKENRRKTDDVDEKGSSNLQLLLPFRLVAAADVSLLCRRMPTRCCLRPWISQRGSLISIVTDSFRTYETERQRENGAS